MKASLKYTIYIAAALACIALLVILNRENSRRRAMLTCQDLKITIVDSTMGHPVHHWQIL